MRFDYRLGKTGALKVFGEAGLQVKYLIIEYPGADSENELLWGPYVKIGVRYAF